MPRRPPPILLLIATYFVANSLAQQNIQIDDNNPAIVYSSGWGTAPSTLDEGGSHHLSGPGGTSFARFTFTGTAIYYMSPLWPYPVITQVQLDSQSAVQLNLTDPNPNARPSGDGSDQSTRSAVVWSSQNLSNTPHALVVTVPSTVRSTIAYAILDTLIYTALDPLPNTSSVSSSTSSTSSTSSGSSTTDLPTNPTGNVTPSSSSNHTLAIALGASLGALGVLASAIAFWFLCCRRGKRSKSGIRPDLTASTTMSFGHSGPINPDQTHTDSAYNLKSSQASYGLNSSQNGSLSANSSNPQVSRESMSAMANEQPLVYSDYTNYTQQPQPGEYNPYINPPPQAQEVYTPQQHSFQQSPYYAPTTLSTITEKSTPGTLNPNGIPLGAASPASYPSADLSYYTPPTGLGAGPRLSYMSDTSSGPANSAYQNQHSLYASGSTGVLRSPLSSGTLGTSSIPHSKLAAQQGPLVAVNREETEPEESRPPAYRL